MATVERQITINAPPEQGFAYVSDISRHSEGAGHQLEVKKTSEGPVQVGSSYETVGHQFGAQPAKVTITELVPDQKIVYESDGQGGHFRHQCVLENEDGSVRGT